MMQKSFRPPQQGTQLWRQELIDVPDVRGNLTLSLVLRHRKRADFVRILSNYDMYAS